MPTVSICIATYRRPAMLQRLLQALQELKFETVREPDITVVIVDNDLHASARPALAEFLSRRYRLRYRVEERPGIAHARNAAIDCARAADFLAFLDDDEEPSPQWLDALLSVQAAFEAAIVAGPVVPRFETEPPSWMLEGRFFHRKRHATGTTLQSAGAGNVLISKDVLRATSPVWFDPRFGFSGGEDTHFFRRSARLGFPVTWADDAVVYECIPDARLTPGYLIRRARNGANHWTHVDLELEPSLLHAGSRFAKGIARVLQGSAISMVAPALGPQQQLRGQLLLAEGMGNLDAFRGRRYQAYGGDKR